MSNLLGQRAVVIGAGIGGLSVAGALAPHFEHVDVLERDRLTASAASRPGTPQDRHPHGLLAGGLQALDEIFPGFEQDLAGAGAVPVSVQTDIRYEHPDVGILPKRDFGIPVFCASRPLIEFALRRKAEAVANIRLRPKCRVTEIVAATDRVRGVRLHAGSGRMETLDADLVIDASGRGTLTLALLDTLGWARPDVTEVGVDISYATAVVKVPADAPLDWKVVVTQPAPPAVPWHAIILPMEGGHWMALIAAHGSAPRVETWEAFLETLRLVITPTIRDALLHAEPPESIRHFGFPASLWRHFERLPRLPHGILPIGDALCRFNPIYGQGMSAAAKQARLLQDVLSSAAAGPDPIAATQVGFMARVASVLQTPWNMSTHGDYAFPGTRGERPEKFEEGRQLEAALFRAVVADPVVHRAVMEVGHLLQPESRLQEPDIVRRIQAVSASAAA
jgi:2-polyprenyl-6-methoxyphenol hydroxylase-like FAD-dependent oxidoreductase